MRTYDSEQPPRAALQLTDDAAAPVPATAGEMGAGSGVASHALARICVRILALVLLFQGITGLPELALVWRDYTLDLYLSAWVLFFALVNLAPLIAGIVFWWQTERITALVAGISSASTPRIRISLRQVFCIALCAVGAMITLQSLPDLAGHMFSLLMRPAANAAQLQPLFVTQAVVSAVETLIGLALVFTARGLAAWAVQRWPVTPRLAQQGAATVNNGLAGNGPYAGGCHNPETKPVE